MALTASAFFWAGCTVVLIPVILHFLMKGRTKREIFPAFRLIQQMRAANRRRFRLKHLLLLFLRCALLILFGLILAQPIWLGKGSSNGKSAGGEALNAVLVFDTSVRMDYQRNNRTRLDEAKELARQILTRLPAKSRAALLDSAGSQDQFQIDLYAAAERIEQIHTGPERRSAAESAAEGIRLLSAEPGKKELFILTDRTAAGWKSESVEHLKEELRNLKERGIEIDFYFADLAVSDVSDISLSSVDVSAAGTEGEAEIRVLLSRFGEPGNGELELSCTPMSANGGEPGKTAVRAFSETDFDENSGTYNAVFKLEGLSPGLYQGAIQKRPADPLTVDDRVDFTFDNSEQKQILLVTGSETGALFMREALAPEEAAENLPYHIEIISAENFKSAELLFPETAAVYFLDTPPLSSAEAKKVLLFVESGGGAGFFLGAQSGKTEDYETAEYQAIFGGKPIRPVRVPEGVSLIPDPGTSQSLFSGFQNAGQIPWSEIPVFRYWRFEWNRGKEPVSLFRFSDGQPAMVQRNLGEGRILISATPFSDLPGDPKAWNRITTGEDSWVFLILADGIAEFLSGKKESLNLDPFQTAVFPISNTDGLAIQLPGGLSVPAPYTEGEKKLRFTGTDKIGSYRILGKNGDVLGGFSVNGNTESFRLDPISFEELQKIWDPFPLNPVYLSGTGGSLQLGKECRFDLQSFLILLFGGLLIAEIAAAGRFYD